MMGIGHLFLSEVNKIGEEGDLSVTADASRPDRADISMWDQEKCALLVV